MPDFSEGICPFTYEFIFPKYKEKFLHQIITTGIVSRKRIEIIENCLKTKSIKSCIILSILQKK